MSAYLLLKAIQGYLEPALTEFPLGVRYRDAMPPEPDAPEPVRPARVLVGSMPPTQQEGVSAAPFIVVQALDGEDTPDGLENIRVALRICIIADDHESAENDLQNLVSQIRLWLMEMPGGILPGGKYRLIPSGGETARLPWTRPDMQEPPFLQAQIYTTWQTRGAGMRPAPNMIDYE